VTAIFSGRFDPPHLGHVLTIKKLFSAEETVVEIDNVIVVVLDYNDRNACTAEEAVDLFRQVFHGTNYNISFIINKIHFAEITKDQYLEFLEKIYVDIREAVYFSGNEKVIEHFKNDLGFPYFFIKRSRDYSGTDEREIMRRGKLTLGEYLDEQGV
jgi:nicotinamide mononucleotide adenylyltransferase